MFADIAESSPALESLKQKCRNGAGANLSGKTIVALMIHNQTDRQPAKLIRTHCFQQSRRSSGTQE
jgi:hypothetical protein